MNDLKKITQIAPEQLEAWQAEYGKENLLVVELQTEGATEVAHTFVFRKKFERKREVLTLANKRLIENKDTIGYNEAILVNATLNGVDVIVNDIDVLEALAPYVGKLVTSYATSLKNV